MCNESNEVTKKLRNSKKEFIVGHYLVIVSKCTLNLFLEIVGVHLPWNFIDDDIDSVINKNV